ncbi:lipocalin-like domain-containing protein [Aridibaculum aurantiacum]|uniref:lipocalin-like domain-containing protein n=1 Tax=Aridibaculum aurantiacum TaxID=2810307 RepID=UPI001A96A041|nr:lipocalin-like domain-containing protein [Aridibaculum aurantiacum]
MKEFYLVFLFALTLTSNSFGQNKVKSNQPKTATTQLDKLIGTWRLIEFSDLDTATLEWKYQYGRNPKGYFTYSKSGIVNINISAEAPLKISRDSAKNYNISLLNWINKYSVGYFGTYTVDFDKSILTHRVEGGSLPWYIDTDQARHFVLKNDTLTIGNSKTWKRVLVKTD